MSLKHNIPHQSQLWLSWKKVKKEASGEIRLISPQFTGPVLQDCEKLEESGLIRLDLTQHFLIIIPRPYIVELRWNKLLRQDKTVVLADTITLSDSDLGCLSILTDTDRILLDCTDHTTEKMAQGVLKYSFRAVVYKETGEPYEF